MIAKVILWFDVYADLYVYIYQIFDTIRTILPRKENVHKRGIAHLE